MKGRKMFEHIAVVAVETMNVLYCGRSQRDAAVALHPGTVHGTARDEAAAVILAKGVAREILRKRSAILLKGAEDGRKTRGLREAGKILPKLRNTPFA